MTSSLFPNAVGQNWAVSVVRECNLEKQSTNLSIVRHINVGLLYEGVTCCQVTWNWLTIGAKCLIRGWWWEVGWVTMLWWWVHYRIKGSINPGRPVFVRFVVSLPRRQSRWWCCRWSQLITSTSLGTTVTARTPVWRNLCRVSFFFYFSDLSLKVRGLFRKHKKLDSISFFLSSRAHRYESGEDRVGEAEARYTSTVKTTAPELTVPH